jgi:hypothetical protein
MSVKNTLERLEMLGQFLANFPVLGSRMQLC